MNEIRAINTRYKGYTFRSRLEARWAVFYDQIGLKWTYESEAIKVNGEAYLPDFRVWLDNGRPIYHEVKPESADAGISLPSVYLAGKVSPGFEWRGEAACTDRNKRLGIPNYEIEEDPTNAWVKHARASSLCGVPFRHVGPFPSSCDHGCSHSPSSLHMAETCGSESKRDIVSACLGSLNAADIVCAHLNATDAFGTLVEIGIAVSLRGKAISLTIEDELCWLLERRSVPGRHSHHEKQIISHDLWFAMDVVARHPQGAVARVANVQKAREFHASFIERKQGVGRPLRLISAIATNGERAALTYGDPYHVSTTGAGHWFQADLYSLCARHKEAAEFSRSYRFDRR